MCDQQNLRSASAYAQSDQSLCKNAAPFCVMCDERVSSDSSSSGKITSVRKYIEDADDSWTDPYGRPDSSLSLLKKKSFKTSKSSDQPAHRRSLIRASACRLIFFDC